MESPSFYRCRGGRPDIGRSDVLAGKVLRCRRKDHFGAKPARLRDGSAGGAEQVKVTTGIDVKHDYYSSEPEMLTKVRTNPGPYDVVLINSARDAQAKADGLIEPIDFAGVPNAAGLAPAFRTNPNILIGGKTYGVPWVWGRMPSPCAPARASRPTATRSSTSRASPGAGRSATTPWSEIAIAALMTGQDINAPADMKKISATLKGFKKSVKLVWSSEDEWNKAFAADAFDVSVFWSGAVTRAVNLHHQPVSFVIPKEGAVGWLDNLCILASSTNKVSISLQG